MEKKSSAALATEAGLTDEWERFVIEHMTFSADKQSLHCETHKMAQYSTASSENNKYSREQKRKRREKEKFSWKECTRLTAR